ncbi:50S ribosomal protein L2 [Candidatus Woesearchaeota archaeon]|nr:50S ribosomal protein L2 [Candidatus Woesearchaeota archaeon]
MGKNLIQQRRGRGSFAFKSFGMHFKGQAKHLSLSDNVLQGKVAELIDCPGHSAPLMKVVFENGQEMLNIAPNGVAVGDVVSCGSTQDPKNGSLLALKDIPEGTSVYNLELVPGDGGKIVRSGGTFAKVLMKSEQGVSIKLPSGKEKIFHQDCRALIGNIAGSGRTDKPFLKAGKKFHACKARNKWYPTVCGVSMNAVDHPFGGRSSHHKGRPTTTPKNAPPGRKVGLIAARRTGRKKK